MPEPGNGHGDAPIEVVPVVVVSQTFPARPSWIPEIRDFVRRCLAESPLTEQGNREVGETVFRALLDAAGPTGAIQVSFRIFPEHVEVNVLHSNQAPELVSRNVAVPPRAAAVSAGPARPPATGPATAVKPGEGRPPRSPTGCPPRCAGKASPRRQPPGSSGYRSRRWAAGSVARPSHGSATCAASRNSSATCRSPKVRGTTRWTRLAASRRTASPAPAAVHRVTRAS